MANVFQNSKYHPLVQNISVYISTTTVAMDLFQSLNADQLGSQHINTDGCAASIRRSSPSTAN
jgi:hypothetical protein